MAIYIKYLCILLTYGLMLKMNNFSKVKERRCFFLFWAQRTYIKESFCRVKTNYLFNYTIGNNVDILKYDQTGDAITHW